VEYTVGEATHLGMSTLLAGVAPKGLWQNGYLLEVFHEATAQCVVASRQANLILVAAGSHLTLFAVGTDKGMRSRREG
jgi:hypothetical protein